MIAARTASQFGLRPGLNKNSFINYSNSNGALSKLTKNLNIFAQPSFPGIKNNMSLLSMNMNSGKTSLLKKSLFNKSKFASQLINSMFNYNRNSTNSAGYSKGNFINILS